MIRLPFKDLYSYRPSICKEDYAQSYLTLLRRKTAKELLPTFQEDLKLINLESFDGGQYREVADNLTDEVLENQETIRQVLMAAKTSTEILKGYCAIFESETFNNDVLAVLLDIVNHQELGDDITKTESIHFYDLSVINTITEMKPVNLTVKDFLLAVNKFKLNLVIKNKAFIVVDEQLKTDNVDDWDQDINAVLKTSNNADEFDSLIKVNASLLANLSEAIIAIKSVSNKEDIAICCDIETKLNTLYGESEIQVLERQVGYLESFANSLPIMSTEANVKDTARFIGKTLLSAIEFLKKLMINIGQFIKLQMINLVNLLKSNNTKLKEIEKLIDTRNIYITVYQGSRNGTLPEYPDNADNGIVEISYNDEPPVHYLIASDFRKLQYLDESDKKFIDEYTRNAYSFNMRFKNLKEELYQSLIGRALFKTPILDFIYNNNYEAALAGNSEFKSYIALIKNSINTKTSLDVYEVDYSKVIKSINAFITLINVKSNSTRRIGDFVSDDIHRVTSDEVNNFKTTINEHLESKMLAFNDIDFKTTQTLYSATPNEVDTYYRKLDNNRFLSLFERYTKDIANQYEELDKIVTTNNELFRKTGVIDMTLQKTYAIATTVHRYLGIQLLINNQLLSLYGNTNIMMGKLVTLNSNSLKIVNTIYDVVADKIVKK